jgi:Protein of unknown function (DUF3105)
MAKKKPRVPTPPAPRGGKGGTTTAPRRPVQAPKVRSKERRPRPSWLLLALAASGVVALVVVIGVIVVQRGGSSGGLTPAQADAAMRAAGCTVRSVPPLAFAANHKNVPTLSTPVRWNTFPPAGGAHYGQTAIWNFYRQPVNPRNVVHNEEHGGVVLWWGPDTPASTVDELERFYQESSNSMIGTPLAASNPGLSYQGVSNTNLGSRVAITAWTIDNPRNYFTNGDLGIAHVAVCNTFNADAFAKFRDAYRGRGPEGIPASFNRAGGN